MCNLFIFQRGSPSLVIWWALCFCPRKNIEGQDGSSNLLPFAKWGVDKKMSSGSAESRTEPSGRRAPPSSWCPDVGTDITPPSPCLSCVPAQGRQAPKPPDVTTAETEKHSEETEKELPFLFCSQPASGRGVRGKIAGPWGPWAT